jgi:hypothetical protein
MKRTLCILLLLAISLGAQQTHFTAVDIYIDSNDAPLAAYQLEFSGHGTQVRIAGIEGGEHEAFKAPPFYDPKAMQQERVILAAFNTAAATKLPTGRIRVATVHLQYAGPQPPTFSVKLHTASDSQGHEISIKPTAQQRNSYE